MEGLIDAFGHIRQGLTPQEASLAVKIPPKARAAFTDSPILRREAIRHAKLPVLPVVSANVVREIAARHRIPLELLK